MMAVLYGGNDGREKFSLHFQLRYRDAVQMMGFELQIPIFRNFDVW